VSNDNELLKAAVVLELRKALNSDARKPADIEPRATENQPWPERRRFWHRRWPMPASKDAQKLCQSNVTKSA
jgi:hypothetical protein